MATKRVSGGEQIVKYLKEMERKLSKRKTMRVGFLEKARYPNGTPIALIAAIQDGGAPRAGIPPRPFFRNMVANKQSTWSPILAQALKNSDFDIEKAFKVLGEVMVGQLKSSIDETNSPPLKPATIKRKGFAKPLVDTGHMQSSADYDIKS